MPTKAKTPNKPTTATKTAKRPGGPGRPKAAVDSRILARLAHLDRYLTLNRDCVVASGIATRAGVSKMKFSRMRSSSPDALPTETEVTALESAAESVTRFTRLYPVAQ